jgi:AAA+ ATPase superfamily predicted ATPase
MVKFVNRTEEQFRINKVLSDKTPGFIVVYGRRRCGKSTLLKKILKSGDIYYVADQTERAQQINLFAQCIAKSFTGFDQVKYPNWEVLFTAFNSRLTQRICLVIDEFPYMVKSSPELPSVLQKLIDKGENKYDLILCGSSQQLMQGLVIESSAPLYGRADLILRIKPLKVSYLKEVLNSNAIETVEEYSVWGGVPRYWELRLKEKSFMEALRANLFSAQGILIEEPLRLFYDDMRDTTQSYTILSLIGNGVQRLSEIASRMEKPATSLSGPLEKLVQLGYIERELPFGENEKNSKKSYYIISDPFIQFYFSFVLPNRSLIEIEKGDVVLKNITNRLNIHFSFCWEKLCRHAISGIELDGFSFGLARKWWGNVSKTERLEIDLIAESIDGKALLFGECKWTENENASRLIYELQQKIKKLPFTDNKKIILCLFLKNKPFDKVDHPVFLPEMVLKMLK